MRKGIACFRDHEFCVTLAERFSSFSLDTMCYQCNCFEYTDYILDFQKLAEWIRENAQAELPLAFTKCPEKKNTLALDLDDTLIHFTTSKDVEGAFKLPNVYRHSVSRPHLRTFYSEVRRWYKSVGIFSAAFKDYVDDAVRILKEREMIEEVDFALSSRLDPGFMKDLTKVPDALLNRVVLVDDQLGYSAQGQKGNLIQFPKGSKASCAENDFFINGGLTLLKHISQVDDVPKEVGRLRELWRDVGIMPQKCCSKL